MPAASRALPSLLPLQGPSRERTTPQALVGSVENTPVMEIWLFPQLVDNLSCVYTSGKGFCWGTLGRKGCFPYSVPQDNLLHIQDLFLSGQHQNGDPPKHSQGFPAGRFIPSSGGIRDQRQDRRKWWQGKSRCPGSLLDHCHG